MTELKNFEIDYKFENSYYTSWRDVVGNKVDANFRRWKRTMFFDTISQAKIICGRWRVHLLTNTFSRFRVERCRHGETLD